MGLFSAVLVRTKIAKDRVSSLLLYRNTYNKPVLTLTGMKMTTQAGDPLLSDAAKKSIIEIFSKGGKLVDQRPLSLVFNEKANNPITLVKVEKK